MSFWYYCLDKIPTKLFLDFCPDIFCTLLGASWKLFGASCKLTYLWYYLLSPQWAQRASKKPPGSCIKSQGRNPGKISLVFWMRLNIISLGYCRINKPLISSPILIFQFFCRYAWASPCRRANLAKTVWMSDNVLNIQGRFVLVYVSAKNSIFGMSDPFDVIPG